LVAITRKGKQIIGKPVKVYDNASKVYRRVAQDCFPGDANDASFGATAYGPGHMSVCRRYVPAGKDKILNVGQIFTHSINAGFQKFNAIFADFF